MFVLALESDRGSYKVVATLLLVSLYLCASIFESTAAIRFFSRKNEHQNFDFNRSECAGLGVPDMPVQVKVQNNYVTIENGLVQVTLSKPDGLITGIQYNGIENLLEVENKEDDRGSWDLVWNGVKFDRLPCTDFAIVMANEKQAELSFTRKWHPSQNNVVPLNIDKRFVMLRGSSGFYTYAIYEHLREWPAFELDETRIAFKLRKDKFNYMAVSDVMQRYMPHPDDRIIGVRGQALAYREAVRLVNPIEPQFKGEVDDKYEYSVENQDIKVHGWICSEPAVGFWQITPSNEFRSSGPLRPELTSHVGPTNLAVFHSPHYCGEDMVLRFGPNEPWKKVFGPIFVYLNSLSSDDRGSPLQLWEDAKEQMMIEEQKWPYNFPASVDFVPSGSRASVSGRLLVQDRYVNVKYIHPVGAYVGLSPPGSVGSWQVEWKGYQFWSRTEKDGHFSISNIRPGVYNLNAWVPGFIGDYQYNKIITINPGDRIEFGDIVYEAPRDGPTLWEIGFPDRSAAEFYIPDPDPIYINRLYLNSSANRFRQYGLWERYAQLYPKEDLVYTIGVSDHTKDWFFSQVTRRKDNSFVGTTWQIIFTLEKLNPTGNYKLRLALASATRAELQVRVNDPRLANPPIFSTGLIGKDNAIARHGIHGLYRVFFVDIAGAILVQGSNTIFLTQTKCISPFQGIMYDYIRLEGPAA